MGDPPRVEVEGVSKAFTVGGSTVAAVDLVDLRVEQGEAVAIIGPNGAGKSTLLSLIAGVQVPTTGRIRRAARCAALLELGAGFHDDLTGRENLDLVLAMAGIARRERARRREAALEFADLGRAADLPAKHLSNGMIGRLACAAALHTEPDLLLLDEVLAVGDSAFQREMLAGVGALLEGGTSLLLVTHSPELAAVATTRTLWLDRGRVVAEGSTPKILTAYEAAVRGWGRSFDAPTVEIERLVLAPPSIAPGDPLRVVADLRCLAATRPLVVRVEVRPTIGDDTIWMRSRDESLESRQLNLVAASHPTPIGSLDAGRHRVEVEVAAVPISSTAVEVSLLIADGERRVLDEVAVSLDIGAARLRPHYHLRAEVLDPPRAPDVGGSGARRG